ncbi:NAD(P)H-binding protein [Ideonella azotifigens]|uniref:NAD(P)H-binding protein n=1 Tax=Ideonella azotifigens TaxID=513160 RepID=A0ABN1KKT2_9BURK
MNPGRRVLIAGATGLVGQALLALLLANASVMQVHALVRRPLAARHAKLSAHVVDFAALPPLPSVDEVYLALGTTIRIAGSQPAFRAVDFDANLAVARAARAAGARRAGLVSAMGAKANASVFYSRVKGEMEDALATVGFDAWVIARPSMLVGDRVALGQPLRRGEQIAETVGHWLGPLIPANYRPVDAARVARALAARVPVAQGQEVLLSGELQRFA